MGLGQNVPSSEVGFANKQKKKASHAYIIYCITLYIQTLGLRRVMTTNKVTVPMSKQEKAVFLLKGGYFRQQEAQNTSRQLAKDVLNSTTIPTQPY